MTGFQVKLLIVCSLIVPTLTSGSALAQEEAIEIFISKLQARMAEVRNQDEPTINIGTLDFSGVPINEALSRLQSYALDPSLRVRKEAIGLMMRAAEINPDIENTRMVTSALWENLKVEEMSRWAARLLQRYNSDDFDSVTKEELRNSLDTLSKWDYERYKIYASANLVEALPMLTSYVEQYGDKADGLSIAVTRRARFAGARLGREEDAVWGVEQAQAETELSRRVSWFKDLAYTRHPIPIEYLVEQLASDEQFGGDGDILVSLVSRRAVMALANCFDDYPITSELIAAQSFSNDDIAAVRVWMQDWRAKTILK